MKQPKLSKLEQEIKHLTADRSRKTCCPACKSKYMARVGWLVEHGFPSVTKVDENFEYTFTKPGPVGHCMNFKQWKKLAIWLSLFFTPIAGPFMAYIVKILYDGGVDEVESARVQKEWARQGFCYDCGITWREIPLLH